jgi:thioredoxin 1
MKKQVFMFLMLSIVFGSFAIAQSKKTAKKVKPAPTMNDTANVVKPHVTFVELGSVNCIPCKAMQPIMKSIEEKYGSQIKVVFYDVWKQDQKHFAQMYNIRLIPTQVFLDANGKELMRHEGYFPEKDIDIFLQTKGLISKSNDKGY